MEFLVPAVGTAGTESVGPRSDAGPSKCIYCSTERWIISPFDAALKADSDNFVNHCRKIAVCSEL